MRVICLFVNVLEAIGPVGFRCSREFFKGHYNIDTILFLKSKSDMIVSNVVFELSIVSLYKRKHARDSDNGTVYHQNRNVTRTTKQQQFIASLKFRNISSIFHII